MIQRWQALATVTKITSYANDGICFSMLDFTLLFTWKQKKKKRELSEGGLEVKLLSAYLVCG